MMLYMGNIYASKSNEIERREIEHAQLSRELATECVVLLENDGALPHTISTQLHGSLKRGNICSELETAREIQKLRQCCILGRIRSSHR
jgi:hypothetical protein